MEFRFSPQEEAFRQQVRDWLGEHLPKNWTGDRMPRSGDYETLNVYVQFAKQLAKKGWVAPHWPQQYGGLGLSVIEQLIFNEEMAYANAPIGYSAIGVGWAGPTIIVYGTEEQKKTHLGAITNAETMWCQGFSEPNAGSDLANLATRAVKDGDDYVINGQKIWTSGAHYANWMILIARTDPEAPKHKGISYFLVNMKTPGISTRPLIDMMDNHAFNEVFFENVRVPRDCLLGEENRGWYMATTTLDFERSSIGGAVGASKMLEDLVAYTRETKVNGHALAAETRVRVRLADAAVEAELGRLLSYRVAAMQARGLVPNYESSIAKLFNTDMQLRMARAGMEIMGLYGQLGHTSKWVPLRGRFERQYLWQTGLAVGGGTTEIQKNIIAMRGLGLPRG
ncbi:MAG: acyl-CoA dehydrogenase family protein [Dehalococcoidia bacterium]|nr:acyl-CoA dehydrogenase family protein [Dehalococcoidia bacterium]